MQWWSATRRNPRRRSTSCQLSMQNQWWKLVTTRSVLRWFWTTSIIRRRAAWTLLIKRWKHIRPSAHHGDGHSQPFSTSWTSLPSTAIFLARSLGSAETKGTSFSNHLVNHCFLELERRQKPHTALKMKPAPALSLPSRPWLGSNAESAWKIRPERTAATARNSSVVLVPNQSAMTALCDCSFLCNCSSLKILIFLIVQFFLWMYARGSIDPRSLSRYRYIAFWRLKQKTCQIITFIFLK